MTSSEAERRFSKTKQIKTCLRDTMMSEMIGGGPLYFNKKAIDYFSSFFETMLFYN